MGNITALNRYQSTAWIDQLTYTYSGTNQVQSIVDASGSNTGLVNGTTTYSYDTNGNLQSNANSVNTTQNKSFTYNLLNLPMVATVSNGTATYTYDAAGNKLRKVSVISGVTTTTEYISGIQYKNSTTAVDFIQTEEGKAVNNSGSYDYNYYLSDNLDNTRVTFGTKTGTAVQYQRDDYYPFGLELGRSVTSPKNEYLYNKKELQEEFTEYDYGARFYDPVIGRWTTIGPLAEISRRWNPYNYVENDPIRLTDPDGMAATDNAGTTITDPTAIAEFVLQAQQNDKQQQNNKDSKKAKAPKDKAAQDKKNKETQQKKEKEKEKEEQDQTYLGAVLSAQPVWLGPELATTQEIPVYDAIEDIAAGAFELYVLTKNAPLLFAHAPKKQSTGRASKNRHQEAYTHGGKKRNKNPNQRAKAEEHKNKGREDD